MGWFDYICLAISFAAAVVLVGMAVATNPELAGELAKAF
jgi:hypothetical protein